MRAEKKIVVELLSPRDREVWEKLARSYQTFYGRTLTARMYESTWQQLMAAESIYGLGAHLHGELIGIAHFLYHPRVWFGKACYLQDLFVDERARGLGAGRALIEAATNAARKCGCSRLYWHTRENNAPARLLYDSLAAFDGFIRYDRAI